MGHDSIYQRLLPYATCKSSFGIYSPGMCVCVWVFSYSFCVALLANLLCQYVTKHTVLCTACVCVHDKLNDAIDHWFDPLWRQMHLNNYNNNERANITLFNTPLSIYTIYAYMLYFCMNTFFCRPANKRIQIDQRTNRPPDRRLPCVFAVLLWWFS